MWMNEGVWSGRLSMNDRVCFCSFLALISTHLYPQLHSFPSLKNTFAPLRDLYTTHNNNSSHLCINNLYIDVKMKRIFFCEMKKTQASCFNRLVLCFHLHLRLHLLPLSLSFFFRVLLIQIIHNHLPICRWTRKKSLFGERKSVRLLDSWRRRERSRWHLPFVRMYHMMAASTMTRRYTAVRCRLK